MIDKQPKYEFNSVFAEFITNYLSLKIALGEKIVSPGNVLRQFDRYCCDVKITRPVLDKETVENWLMQKQGEGISTHAHRLSTLKGFAEYLSSINVSVTWHPKPGYAGRQQRYIPYIFTKEEIKRIFIVADTLLKPYGNSQFHLIFPTILKVLYGCGLRISEALALKVKDVDLEQGFLLIQNTKFGKSRKVPVSNSLLKTLRLYNKVNANLIGFYNENYFFPTARGERYSTRTVYDKFRQVLWSSGIPHQGKGKGPRVHDLRHTFAVHSLQQHIERGTDIYVALTSLKVYLGHGKITATEYYLRLTAEVFPDFLQRAESISTQVIPKAVQYEE